DHLFHAGAGQVEQDVASERPGECRGLLEHDPAPPSYIARVQLREWNAVVQDLTGRWLIEAEQEHEDCAFPRSRWTDNADLLARRDGERSVIDDQWPVSRESV